MLKSVAKHTFSTFTGGKCTPLALAAFATKSDVAITRQAHAFLQQHGYINGGMPRDEGAAAAAAAERVAAEAGLLEAAAAKAEYELALQAFEILKAVDMEVPPGMQSCPAAPP